MARGVTWRRTGLAAGAAAVSLVLSACGEHRPAAPAAEVAPAAGRLTVAMQTVPDLKPVPATLTTRDMADARSRITGILVSLSVKEGDTVRQGQVIGRVKDDRIGMQVSAYDAQVSAAAAQAANAQADLARTRDLFSHGVYAQARLDQVEAQAKAAQGALSAARAQRAAGAELGAQGAIIAPRDGRVLTAAIPVGSVVAAGQSVATLTAGPMVVRIELPEGEGAAVQTGDKVRLDPRDLGGAAVEGVVSQVYPAVQGGQVTADVTAPALPSRLIGQRIRATVQVGRRQAIVIPRAYLATRFGVDYARLVGPGGAVSEIPVETAPGLSEGTVEILSGLKAGDILTPARPGR